MQENVNIPDSTITTNLSFRQLVLMNMQQLTNFPYIEKDFDALTDYELLCLVVKYLNDVIANQNEQNDSITRMYESFLALQTYVNNTKDTLEDAFNNLDDYVRNYFANLDVQDEIDHKLDEYVEDGTLEHIIASYLQTQKIYNTHTEMISDASNLVDGLNVQTLGYYNLNDGGGAFYHMTVTASQTEYQEQIGDLYATMIIEDSVNVAQFGAYGDNLHDDTEAIKKAISSNANVINFIKNKTYNVTPYNINDPADDLCFVIPPNTTIDLCDSTIKVIPNNREYYKVFTFLESDNSTLKNGSIIGDLDNHQGTTGEWGHGVSIRYSNNVTVENLNISKCWGDGIDINRKDNDNFDFSNINIINCICDENRRQGMSIEAGNNILIEKCQFINTGKTNGTNPKAGIDIEPLISDKTLENITIKDCIFKENRGMQIVGGGNKTNNINVINLTIDNCVFDDTNSNSEWILWLRYVKNSKLINSIIGNTKKVVLQPSNNFILENNQIHTAQLNTNFDYCEDSIISIINNYIKSPSTIKMGTGLIQNYSSTQNINKNNSLLIHNNQIIDKTSGEYVYDPGVINILFAQGCDKLILTNNTIIGGRDGVNVEASSIIKNNIIMGTTRYGCRIAGDANVEKYFDIENNQFQNCGSENQIIFNYYKKNLVLRNNIYYPIYFNTGIGETNYSKTKYLLYETGLTGYNLIEDNNIISLTE